MSAYKSFTEPRTGRAVLGDKTTNTKARINQQQIDRSQAKPTTVSRPKSSGPKPESAKLQILQDTTDPLSSEPDTNLPPPEPLPYESDVWADGVLTFDAIRPENRMKGYFEHYHNRRDENGMTRLDREMKAAQDRRFREADAKIRKDLDEDFKWDLGLLDSPRKTQHVVPARDPGRAPVTRKLIRPNGRTTRAPSTISSRRAAAALGMASRPALSMLSSTLSQRRPLATRQASSAKATANVATSRLPSFMRPTVSKARNAAVAPMPMPMSSSTAGLAASRSTLGYTKGRSASSAIQARSRSELPPLVPSRALSRAADTRGESPVDTITPAGASHARVQTPTKPEFVSIFDGPLKDDEDDDDGVDADGSLFGKVDSDEGGDGSAVDPPGEDEDDEFRLELQL